MRVFCYYLIKSIIIDGVGGYDSDMAHNLTKEKTNRASAVTAFPCCGPLRAPAALCFAEAAE